MAEVNGFQKVVISVANFFRNAVKQIKKGDKRFIIMAAAALALLIIILALIIHGVSSGKKPDEHSTEPPAAVVNVNTTEPQSAVAPQKVLGKYITNTASKGPVNMRSEADSSSNRKTTIPYNTEVELLFIDDSMVKNTGDYGWGYVDYNGNRGWVYMEYLVPAN